MPTQHSKSHLNQLMIHVDSFWIGAFYGAAFNLIVMNLSAFTGCGSSARLEKLWGHAGWELGAGSTQLLHPPLLYSDPSLLFLPCCRRHRCHFLSSVALMVKVMPCVTATGSTFLFACFFCPQRLLHNTEQLQEVSLSVYVLLVLFCVLSSHGLEKCLVCVCV